ncbi:hypothetical protein Ddc_00951 [Ditylenchus destructor]|nr:hypothetical protein Ddc_00951 [Ditylenchus destructor]
MLWILGESSRQAFNTRAQSSDLSRIKLRKQQAKLLHQSAGNQTLIVGHCNVLNQVEMDSVKTQKQAQQIRKTGTGKKSSKHRRRPYPRGRPQQCVQMLTRLQPTRNSKGLTRFRVRNSRLNSIRVSAQYPIQSTPRPNHSDNWNILVPGVSRAELRKEPPKINH